MEILLIDGYVLFREGLAMMLNSYPDIKVVGEADNLRNGISKARELQPHIVLMDFNLPDGDSVENIEAILRVAPKTNIVVLTIQDSDQLLVESIFRGAKGFIQKNRPIASVVASLRAVLQGEAALSREMTSRVIEELSRMRKLLSPSRNGLDCLTTREMEVLSYLTTGKSNREISQSLSISNYTVKAHVRHILKKLNVRNRREAAKFGRRMGGLDYPYLLPRANGD